MSKGRFSILLLLISLFFVGNTYAATPLSSAQILDLLNQDRQKHGLAELQSNPILNLAALAKADDMLSKKYFAHVSPEGTKPWHWFKRMGYNYTYAGENLAEGYHDARELENSWMNSPTHRANILSPFYSDVGLAVVSYQNVNLVVQFFGSTQNKVSLREW
ncbi:MAG: hypothetical protein A2660_00400 [Candidatus Doudnabacteria bacterium RIFCSPHIGHO2_01_FULL_45_18]|uniref:SCP domain-containing protein n=1 Tax=Candidatus Doudnabacteria bacterium RIFCSPHIGHO2_01_FULL_45_18 TaxID=1817823 RepID=A0A1F5NQE6_9BACT|nr:MAG: hypothetical protein A2660_00400 [Candidatus Doudnabacteria bacterium RIFCSPHIGHO2_01_FULL_45_18]